MPLKKTDLPDPELTKNARTVLDKRYLYKDEDQNPTERPKDMFVRVAEVIASEEKKYDSPWETDDLAEEFYRLMSQGYFEPNSPTLMNAGRVLGQLSACFVLPVEDDLTTGDASIYGTLKDMATIHQSGGGTGFSFSRLRPEGSIVNSTKGVASGPVSFMRLYDASTECVKQGGTRRGANMGILHVRHPDIEKFIDCKSDEGDITNFNISVAVDDAFMELAKEGSHYTLWNGTSKDAGEVLQKIAENAHKNGEPGLFFIDEANAQNPVPHIGSYEATNPCAEQPLLPYDSCNLGSINLSKYVRDGAIDHNKLARDIHLGVRFLDNVIDANQFPLPEIEDLARRIRRIGFGVMGWADALIKLGVPYDSDEARSIARDVARFVHAECISASQTLASERGPFPEWERAREESDLFDEGEAPRRNCNVNTVAPTGTISIIAGCSGGIEPLYAVAFKRFQAGEEMIDVHPYVEENYDVEGLSLSEINDLVSEDPLLRTAHDISPEDHVRMQAVWQDHVESSISKTINFDESASVEDIRDAYDLAWDLDCKALSVYRDGSREGQALQRNEQEEDARPRERPDVVPGYTHRTETPLGTAYVNVGLNGDNKPFEVFVTLGKAGGAANADAEAIGRLISLNLRSGVPMSDIVRQLKGIATDKVIGFGDDTKRSLPDALAKTLEHYANERVDMSSKEEIFGACPDCKAHTLVKQEGCAKCASCGYSRC